MGSASFARAMRCLALCQALAALAILTIITGTPFFEEPISDDPTSAYTTLENEAYTAKKPLHRVLEELQEHEHEHTKWLKEAFFKSASDPHKRRLHKERAQVAGVKRRMKWRTTRSPSIARKRFIKLAKPPPQHALEQFHDRLLKDKRKGRMIAARVQDAKEEFHKFASKHRQHWINWGMNWIACPAAKAVCGGLLV